ncbi:MAG: DoxX family protein [Planctomycetota bacterium]|jgi:putative oxidoreductase
MRKIQIYANDIGLLLIRLMLGTVFVFHGSQKLFGCFGGHGLSGMADFLEQLHVPAPMVSAVLAGSAEFFGGLALLLGVGVRIAVIPMVFTMLVAVYKVHWGVFSSQKGGMEYPLTLAVILIALGLLGPGRQKLPTLIRACRRKATKKNDAEEA